MDTLPERAQINRDLVAAYDRMAQLRERDRVEPWKRRERREFAALLMGEGRTRLLEIGAGTGKDALWFKENGVDVTCLDLSPRMVELCRRKGLEARVMDFFHPDLPPESFDALFSLNSLVHVSRSEYPEVLAALRQLVRPSGLFYLGQYGGSDFEGILERDNYRPKRFFYFPREESLREMVGESWSIESFRTIQLVGRDYVFYSVILRKKPE